MTKAQELEKVLSYVLDDHAEYYAVQPSDVLEAVCETLGITREMVAFPQLCYHKSEQGYDASEWNKRVELAHRSAEAITTILEVAGR